jgi:hypothetical protein
VLTHPTCGVNGSIVLNFTGVADGTYTITYGSGSFSGVSVASGTATISAPAGTYNNLQITTGGCTSASGINVTLTGPVTPSAPVIGTITQPTCSVATGTVALSGLPASGAWTLTATGGATLTGSGTTAAFTGLSQGTYTFTVTGA